MGEGVSEEDEELAIYRERPEVKTAAAAVLSGDFTDRQVSLVIPLIPEFRESMRKAENARAEGRVISGKELLSRLEEMDRDENR